MTPMPPPPPPPPGAGRGPPPPMPPQLQAMMRQMQKRQPKLQQEQQMQPPAPRQQHQGGRGAFRGGRGHGGRGRGRGRGRGGFQQHNFRQNHGQPQFKRKRGPSDDVRDASRFFLPSFLVDPWKQLEAANARRNGEQGDAMGMQDGGRPQREEMRPRQMRQQRYAMEDGPGRVFFQPSFMQDPWAQLVR